MKLENELNTINNTPNADKNKIEEDKYDLSTEKLKYQQIRKGLDENGNIISDIDGNIVNINSEVQVQKEILMLYLKLQIVILSSL